MSVSELKVECYKAKIPYGAKDTVERLAKLLTTHYAKK